MKTAISVPDTLFHEVEKIAKEDRSTRSQVFSDAVREYLEKRRSRKLLEDLNEALAVAETSEEYTVRQKSMKRYARTLARSRS